MKTKALAIGVVLSAAVALAAGTVRAASLDHGSMRDMAGPMGAMGQDHHGPGMMRGMMRGMAMGVHDGSDATSAELDDIHALFQKNDRITRTVVNLPDGIRTLTESDDPAMAQTIKDHVAGMMQRVGEKRDPNLPIESPALKAIFQHYDKIETRIETTDKGILVTQTSNDPEAVTALQTHAGEVTDFAKRGMAAMHDAMMRRQQEAMRNEPRDAPRGHPGTMPEHGRQPLGPRNEPAR